MAKIARNDACPCGSGKKYKKCCLVRDEARREAEAKAQAAAAAPMMMIEDDLDQLSNSVVDLIRDKRLDEALAACERLEREYPDVIDYLERYARVYEARGEWALAASYYLRALAFTEKPEQRDGFEEAGREDFRKKAAQNQARADAG